MKRILIINPFGIGDVLFTTPVISNIKSKYPDSFIGYWCNERVKGILENNPRIDKIFALSRGDLKKIFDNSKIRGICRLLGMIRQIKQEKFEVCLDYSLDHRYSLLAKFSGIAKRAGFDYKNRGIFLTHKLNLSSCGKVHMADYYLSLLKFVDKIEPVKFDLELYVSDASRLRTAKIFSENNISDNDLLVGIGFGGGASWGIDAELKHWPKENFAFLADKLMEGLNARILLLGDLSEKPLAAQIIKKMRHSPLDLTGALNLEDLAACLERLRLLITNDSGLLHMAVALGKKTLSFFGPTSPLTYGPRSDDRSQHVVLRKGLDCSPCYQNFRLSGCLFNKDCLRAIDVEAAFRAANNLLAN